MTKQQWSSKPLLLDIMTENKEQAEIEFQLLFPDVIRIKLIEVQEIER